MWIESVHLAAQRVLHLLTDGRRGWAGGGEQVVNTLPAGSPSAFVLPCHADGVGPVQWFKGEIADGMDSAHRNEFGDAPPVDSDDVHTPRSQIGEAHRTVATGSLLDRCAPALLHTDGPSTVTGDGDPAIEIRGDDWLGIELLCHHIRGAQQGADEKESDDAYEQFAFGLGHIGDGSPRCSSGSRGRNAGVETDHVTVDRSRSPCR